MRLYARHAAGLFLASFLAVGCGGQGGDLPTAPASSGPSEPAPEKQEGKTNSIMPADAAEKYK